MSHFKVERGVGRERGEGRERGVLYTGYVMYRLEANKGTSKTKQSK
jgi:hypothetical protein